VVRMVEFPIDDIFDEIFVLFHFLSFLLKKKPSSKPWSAFFGKILILVRLGANKFLVYFLIYMCYGLVVKMVIGSAHTSIFEVLLILGLE